MLFIRVATCLVHKDHQAIIQYLKEDKNLTHISSLLFLCGIPRDYSYYNDETVKLFGQSAAE
jgi:hypothetical protein